MVNASFAKISLQQYHCTVVIHLFMFQIKWSVLKDYIKAGGLGYMSLLIIFFLVYIGGMLATSLWCSAWSDDPYDPSEAGVKRTRLRLRLYGVFGAIQSMHWDNTLSMYCGHFFQMTKICNDTDQILSTQVCS